MRKMMLAPAAVLVLVPLTGCDSTGSYAGGCSTANGMSVARKVVSASVTVNCTTRPTSHYIRVQLEYRKAKGSWHPVGDPKESRQTPGRFTVSLRYFCDPGQYRIKTNVRATFVKDGKQQTVTPSGTSSTLDTTNDC